jgi:hypothetical protein
LSKGPSKGVFVASASNWWASFDFVEFSLYILFLILMILGVMIQVCCTTGLAIRRTQVDEIAVYSRLSRRALIINQTHLRFPCWTKTPMPSTPDSANTLSAWMACNNILSFCCVFHILKAFGCFDFVEFSVFFKSMFSIEYAQCNVKCIIYQVSTLRKMWNVSKNSLIEAKGKRWCFFLE